MASNTQHQPGIRELSVSDIDLVSGGGGGIHSLITIQQAQTNSEKWDVERRFNSSASSFYGKTNDAMVQNIRG